MQFQAHTHYSQALFAGSNAWNSHNNCHEHVAPLLMETKLSGPFGRSWWQDWSTGNMWHHPQVSRCFSACLLLRCRHRDREAPTEKSIDIRANYISFVGDKSFGSIVTWSISHLNDLRQRIPELHETNEMPVPWPMRWSLKMSVLIVWIPVGALGTPPTRDVPNWTGSAKSCTSSLIAVVFFLACDKTCRYLLVFVLICWEIGDCENNSQ